MASEIKIYNPEELGPPMGQYTHVTRVKANEFLFIAGMLSGQFQGQHHRRRRFRQANRPGIQECRGGAEIGRRRLGQRRAVHHLSRAFPGHPEIHGVPAARIPKNVSERKISAEYAIDGRPAGSGALFGRGADHRGDLIGQRPAAAAETRLVRPTCPGRDRRNPQIADLKAAAGRMGGAPRPAG